jgi:uncharacterized membrane protein
LAGRDSIPIDGNLDEATDSGLKDRLSSHIEETVRTVAQLHAEHHEKSTTAERAIDRATALIGRPSSIAFLILGVLLWAMWANIHSRLGIGPFDAPPFPWLQDILTLAGVLMGVLILTTQRRADRLASLREQMTLELASLTEKKVAKIIALIEELRRDSPQLVDRVDDEAREMAARADPHAMLGAIRDTHEEMTSKIEEGN